MNPAVPAGRGFLTDPWGLVEVTGEDATSFLQALVSQDLDLVAVGQSVPCLLLHPQGKLDVAFRAHRTADGWWCSTEPSAAPRLSASLARFRIRVRAEITDRTDGTARAEVVSEGDAVPSLPAVPTGCVGATVQSVGSVSFEVVGPVGLVTAWLDGAGVPVGSPAEREVWRVAAGIARQDVDLDDGVIPQEAFLEIDAVSFTKGCFLGQELVCRIDSRGHVNRFLRRLRLDAPVRVGDEIRHEDRAVGTITSVAEGPDGVVALGFLRREVEPPASVRVGAPAVPGAVLPGPDAAGSDE